MTRQRVTLGAPPGDGLAGFPRLHVDAAQPVYRIVRGGRGPWWFSSSGEGRFDLSAPLGTCYLALDPFSALLDVIGPDVCAGLVSTAFFEERRVRELRLPRAHAFADVADRGSVAFGVTGELHTVTPYALPQRWARAFADAGFDGVRYRLRHDPAASPDGLAVFGPAGEQAWARGRERRIGRAIVDRLRRECGVRVAPVPHSSELTFADDE